MKYPYAIPSCTLLAISLLFASCSGEKASSAESIEETPASPSASLTFTDITREAGIVFSHQSGAYGEFFMPEIMGGGAAFWDYNGDNWPDILLVGGGAWEKSPEQNVPSLQLWENQQDGTFKEVTSETGLDKIKTYAFGCSVADYDNDGDDDVYITALKENILLRNDAGKLVNVAQFAGVKGGKVWSTASIFLDADKDGWLDLYVGNYIRWSQEMDRNIWCSIDGETDNYCHPNLYEGEQGVFYRNNGDGTFSDETAKRGFIGPNGIAPIKTLGLAAIDVDQDGWQDLVMANDMQPDLLFRNKGDGTFEEIGTAAGIAYNRQGKPRAGMGIVIGDMDNSGKQSIAVGNFSRQPISIYKALPGGMFMDNTYASQIGKPSFLTLTFGLSLFDADLDGDQDLLAANGHVFVGIEKKASDITFRQLPHFFVNNGQGLFEDQAAQMGEAFADSIVSRASATADIDGDGDLDVLLTENNGPVHLLRNESSQTPHYLRILVRGAKTNLNSIGAKVELFDPINGRQVQWVKSSEGYLSQSEFTLTFGLGQAESVDSVQVTWPDGTRSRFSQVLVDQHILIEKDTHSPISLSSPSQAF